MIILVKSAKRIHFIRNVRISSVEIVEIQVFLYLGVASKQIKSLAEKNLIIRAGSNPLLIQVNFDRFLISNKLSRKKLMLFCVLQKNGSRQASLFFFNVLIHGSSLFNISDFIPCNFLLCEPEGLDNMVLLSDVLLKFPQQLIRFDLLIKRLLRLGCSIGKMLESSVRFQDPPFGVCSTPLALSVGRFVWTLNKTLLKCRPNLNYLI